MSLVRQLWLSVILILLASSLTNFFISTYFERKNLQEQLYLKNVDDVNSLALMLSQDDKQLTDIELLIAATFDAGHYQRIELIDPAGDSIFKRQYRGELTTDVPALAQKVFHFEVEPGIAQVSSGWNRIGTLYLESHTQYVHEALWHRTQAFFVSFIIISLVAGLIGSLVLHFILKPLDMVVEQAHRFSEKRFMTLPLPRTKEFAKVVLAMNSLAKRFKSIIEDGNKRLDELRYRGQHDELTGLANCEAFETLLDAQLKYRDREGHNVLFMLKIFGMSEISLRLEKQRVDEIIVEFTQVVFDFTKQIEGRFTDVRFGRLNGSEFCILLTEAEDIQQLSDVLVEAVRAFKGRSRDMYELYILHAGVYLSPDETRTVLMRRVQALLIEASKERAMALIDNKLTIVAPFNDDIQWRKALNNALSDNIHALTFPVVRKDGSAIHYQALMGLELDNDIRKGGYFVHWARRLNMIPQIDVRMIEHILAKIEREENAYDYAILLSYETMIDEPALTSILNLLNRDKSLAQHVCLEVRESVASAHFDLFKHFTLTLKDTGCKIGLKRVGDSFSTLLDLQELGLDYIKIDSAFVYNVSINVSNQNFLRGLCSLAHSLGIVVIADGVTSKEDGDTLFESGFDGMISLMQQF
ncbi:bifunctional diguanylate cyclase/phosphodiesterase [Paraglaciecola polaris]|uniref:Diguanylate cyclase/phosphodiesterase n=1 Tax=Paraglaciecola polaris LMG 21857 TaxID=1129793 RepID=K6Z4H0_9ALTE|nr:EAL domain-containing protein [Paraglaciecola polaris]GAC31131.1 diguanylate cyclase/phosphodiesterase [Paraglaciecola polaris LMG 21857]|tara:strand:- start:1105 stop:3027 length:1923 start_codon:yes stop_codon:yes gene_type:complete